MEQLARKVRRLNSNRSIHPLFTLNINNRRIIFSLAAIICLLPFISPPVALMFGIILAQLIEHPYLHLNHKTTNLLLKISVIGLGFGMNLFSAIAIGKSGLSFTMASIFSVLFFGYFIGKVFKIESKTSFLIAAGTAICGGSAIAALSPVMNAEEKQISVALAIVFVLNSIALFVFPTIGHALKLTQSQFGMWCAIAIHDTSSVVGAASKYGDQALQIATTVKLARALWIVPIAFLASILFKGKNTKGSMPYFIGLFILAMMANTYIPFIKPFVPYILKLAKAALTLTLFLIGSALSIRSLKGVGIMPFLQGIILWALISIGALGVVINML